MKTALCINNGAIKKIIDGQVYYSYPVPLTNKKEYEILSEIIHIVTKELGYEVEDDRGEKRCFLADRFIKYDMTGIEEEEIEHKKCLV